MFPAVTISEYIKHHVFALPSLSKAYKKQMINEVATMFLIMSVSYYLSANTPETTAIMKKSSIWAIHFSRPVMKF